MMFAAATSTLEELCARLPSWETAVHLVETYFEVSQRPRRRSRQIGSFHNFIFKPRTFRPHLEHVYQSREAGATEGHRLDPQRLALVCFVLAKGAAFDVGLPACKRYDLKVTNLRQPH